MRQLCPHHGRTADRAAQRGFVEHHAQADRVFSEEPGLAGHAQTDPAGDLLGIGVSKQRDGAGVVFRLQQAGHELHLVPADLDGGLLEADVLLEPGRQDGGVVLPPAARVGADGDAAQRLYLRLVGDAVMHEQVDDVAVLEGHAAALQPAHLRVGGADDVTRLLQRDPLRLTQPPKLGPEENTQHSGVLSSSQRGHVQDRALAGHGRIDHSIPLRTPTDKRNFQQSPMAVDGCTIAYAEMVVSFGKYGVRYRTSVRSGARYWVRYWVRSAEVAASFHPGEKRVPRRTGEDQRRAVGKAGVPQCDAAGQVRRLHAVAARVAVTALTPGDVVQGRCLRAIDVVVHS